MSETLEQRACELAVYMIETGATVRAAAKHFHISKSTVHTINPNKLNFNIERTGTHRLSITKNINHPQNLLKF